MADWKMVNFDSSVLEGHIKFRDKKKWKRRWCILRRLSPVANSLTMQLYKKVSGKSSQTQNELQPKASLNLEHLLGLETCFLLGKESQTLAIICKSATSILAFENRETLLEWHALISEVLGHSEKFEVQLLSFPAKFEIGNSIATLHIRDWQFSLIQGIPPRLLGYWNLADLRRFGAFDDRRFCFEGGSRCSFKGGEGVFVLGSNKSRDIGTKFELAVRGRLSESHRFRSNPTSPPSGLLTPLTRHRLSFSSRPMQSMSKPCTPLLSSHRRAAELCLSPPCSRHFRSASQQHSRHSSFSSGTNNGLLTRNSALQQSDPEMLYDKPRSLNVTMTNATLEANTAADAASGPLSTSRPSSTLPTNHYDTPRRVLAKRSLLSDAVASNQYKATQALLTSKTENQAGTSTGTLSAEEISALYATVVKPKRQASAESETDVAVSAPEESDKFRRKEEVEGYLRMQSSRDQWPDYVQMQPLPFSPASLLKMSREGRQCLVPSASCSDAPTARSECRKLSNGSKVWNHQYQNAVWLQLQAMSTQQDGHELGNSQSAAYHQTNSLARCLHSKTCHGTLPLVHPRGGAVDGVNLRLRRSASMPCRQGNRDSSDSTDSGVSVTADSSGAQLPAAAALTSSGYSHHLLCRHWSLPRPTNALPSNKSRSKNSRLQPWPNTPLCDSAVVASGDAGPTTCASRTTRGEDASPLSHSSSNDSNISQLLDQLETLSVASTGYETCV